jgi:Reverse transcriptase (RNA-dependent DNA polymerase)
VQLPPGRKAIGSRWVFKVKRNADGSIERYKARLVAQGFAQRPGFDYTETFAPTPKWAALRAIFALAAIEDLELESVDISGAYLNGELDEEVYMKQPEGFEEKGKDWYWRLLKSLYGLKQAGRQWHKKLNEVLEQVGFKRTVCEHSIWVFQRGEERVIIPVFIDDMTIAARSKEAIQQVKDDLRKHFKLRDLGPTSFLLGVEVKRNRSTRTLTLSQRQYILDLLERFSLSDCNTVTTPLDPSIRLSSAHSPQTPEDIEAMRSVPYLQAVGALMYLAVATRPDISYTVGVLARFSKNPGPLHWKAVKHLFRYLKGTLDYKLTYSRSTHPTELFVTYTDADHAGNPDNGRSTSGYIVKMGDGAISWSSRLQGIVALSTTEAEYVAATSAAQEILWLRNLFTELGYKFDSPSTLYIDNQSALSVAKNPEHHGRMKHLDLRFYWLRDEVDKGVINVVHLPTDEMPADVLTKALGRVKVGEMVDMLGLQA